MTDKTRALLELIKLVQYCVPQISKPLAMPRTASPIWEHVVKVSDTDGSILRTECIHCHATITPNASHINAHMYGTPEGKTKDVIACSSEFAKNLRAMRAAQAGGSSSGGSSAEMFRGKRHRQLDMRDMHDDTARNTLDYLFATAVAENDWAFRCSE